MCLLSLSSQLRSSSVSVVFDFNASLNDVAPVPPMLLAVDVMRKKKSELVMDVFCVFFLSYSHSSSSTVSVAFDFNASLSDVAPMPPILLTVGVIRREKSELLMDVFCVFFCVDISDSIQ